VRREITAGVFLGERRVGTLTFADEITRFDYTDVELGHLVLGQAFEDEPGRRRVSRIDVPAWFANLLPEAESPLRQMVANQYGLSAVRSFPLLLALGGDLSGAVEVRPDVDISSLVDPPEGWSHDSGSDRPRLAFSLAGVQLKFSMLREGRRFTLPMSGVGGQWIVKLPDRAFRDVPSNEHAMMRWAAAAGCDVPATELVTGADVGLPESLVAATEPVFAIRRFDRTDDRRVHVEDLAQVREVAPRYKYDNSSYDAIGRVIRTVAGDAAFEEYIRRLVLVVAMGNGDAHLKNWSLIYRDGITVELAPAYDMVSVTAYEQFTADRLAFRLGGERSFSAVHRGHFRRLAGSAEADVDRIVDVVDEATARLHEAWPAVVREYPVPDFVRRHISGRLTELPLLKGV